MLLLSLSLATMVSAQTPAPTAPAKKKTSKSTNTKAKAEPAPAPAASELKPAPAPEPVAAPAPTPAPVAAPLPAPTPTPVPAVVERPAPVTPPSKSQFLLGALGGIVTPFSVLATGERVGLVAEYHLGALPLGVLLNVAFEQHTAVQSTLFAPPAGGLDPAAIENQSVVPVELAVAYSPWHDEANRLALAVGYGLLPTSTETRALGSTTLEAGLGHEVLGEVGYTRALGPVNLLLRLRYAVRHTAVGARTSTMELPWYQSFGVSAGLAFGM